jgi:hypothetical protein
MIGKSIVEIQAMSTQSRTMVRPTAQVSVVDRPLPVAAAGEAVVRSPPRRYAIPIRIYTGGPKSRYPVIFGMNRRASSKPHDRVPGLAAGQPVLINPVITCGHCDCCQRGNEHLCRNAGLFGREIEGSLSQYVKIQSRYLYPQPAGMRLDDATLIETLATVRHAQVRAQLQPGESVVVFGQGATGLLHTQLAALSGCKPVIAVSRSRWKLDRAAAMVHTMRRGRRRAGVAEVMRWTEGCRSDGDRYGGRRDHA